MTQKIVLFESSIILVFIDKNVIQKKKFVINNIKCEIIP